MQNTTSRCILFARLSDKNWSLGRLSYTTNKYVGIEFLWLIVIKIKYNVNLLVQVCSVL